MRVTLIEKYILDSLNMSSRTFSELLYHTELDRKYLENSLQTLLNKKMLERKMDKYFIDVKQVLLHRNDLLEVQDALKSITKRKIKRKNEVEEFRYRKFSLKSNDEAIFKSMLYNLNDFVIKHNIADKVPLKDQKLFVCFVDSYSDVVRATL
jgi:DNA-binding HxlR family transcriptional regulator